MTNNPTPATSNQREAIGLALLSRLLPSDLTEAEATLLLEKIDEVGAVAAPVVTKIIRPPAKPEMKIEVIAEFELDGQRFDAVLVHQEGEDRVPGEEAIRRADEDRPDAKVVRSEEDWQRVYAHRAKLPAILNGKWLATARPHPVYPRSVSGLDRNDRGWYGRWGGLVGQWDRSDLVLRRRT